MDSRDRVKIAIAIVVTCVLAFGAALVFAGDQDHTCQGGHNCNEGGSGEQTQTQTQTQTQNQSQSSTNTNENEAVSSSNAGASSVSGSVSNSGGNSLSAVAGESRSSSDATGGSASATAGDAVAHGGQGGAGGGGGAGGSSDSGGNSQDSTIYVGGDNYEVAASSAASVFAGYCQSGASGQVEGGGFSVVQTEQFCNHIRLANVMYQAYEREMKGCATVCVGVCTDARAEVWTDRGGAKHCTATDTAEDFLDAYYDNLWDANALMQSTDALALIDRGAKQLVTPLAIILALILL